MNWDAIGAIAEMVGVVAIFVSLIYVAVQIRQNTEQLSRSAEAAELSAFERNIESGNGIRELLILHPDVSRLLLKGMKSYSALESLEKFRFGMLLRNLFSSSQGAYIRQISVRNDPNDSEGIGELVDSFLVNPGVQEWLKKSTPDWRPEFREFVNRRLTAIKKKTA